MRYLKLFEEFKGDRITVTTEEKKKLREIARIIIKYCESGKLTSGISEKYTIQFDLGYLKNLITGNWINRFGEEDDDYARKIKVSNEKCHKDNGYEFVDNYAKKISKLRGVDIVFDRENSCFITKSGKAMTTININSEYPNSSIGDGTGGYQSNDRHTVLINYDTGDIIDEKGDKSVEKLKRWHDNKNEYVTVWDFTGDNIHMSINRNIRWAKSLKSSEEEETVLTNIFSTLYHEFTHSKDPLTWQKNYLGNKEIYSIVKGDGGVYSSHDTEVQTFSNQLLELIEYYFERTLRGDKDGNGVNYNLSKEDVINNFIPTILEIVEFIDGERDLLSDKALDALRGNKNRSSIISIESHIVQIRKEDPEDGKVIRQWMRDDFNRFVDYYNTRVIEINKQKQKGQELPLLDKGFPFGVTAVKPTPANVQNVTDAIEETPDKKPLFTKKTNKTSSNSMSGDKQPSKPGVKPFVKKSPVKQSIDNANLKFATNKPPKDLPSKFDANELINLLDKYSNVFPTVYSKCFSQKFGGALALNDVKEKFETLFREVKTKDPVRIKEAIKSFFDNIGPKVSDINTKSWLQSSDGRKWGEAVSKFEQICSIA